MTNKACVGILVGNHLQAPHLLRGVLVMHRWCWHCVLMRIRMWVKRILGFSGLEGEFIESLLSWPKLYCTLAMYFLIHFHSWNVPTGRPCFTSARSGCYNDCGLIDFSRIIPNLQHSDWRAELDSCVFLWSMQSSQGGCCAEGILLSVILFNFVFNI